jgi:IS605 OrfB family transposase
MSRIVVPVKLVADRKATDDLVATLRACNAAANQVSGVAWERGIFRNFSLRAVTYGDIRSTFGLGAQAAQHTIKKVADAYNSGKPEYRRSRHRAFRWQSSQPFDARNLSFDVANRTVSIWTVNGRAKAVPFACADWQAGLLDRHPIGETDLLYRNGALYLYATVDVDDPPMNEHPVGFIGVDLGIVNIATMSDGTNFSGSAVNRVRHRNRRLRGKLQQKGTRSAKRLLAKRSGLEARFAKDVNHCISKKIVAEAERTGHGIALEDLEGIRGRVRSRKPQRATLHSWSFHQLGSFIDYKSTRAGVPVVYVDPAYTSQGCSGCGHISKKNRRRRATFLCTSCGLSLPADWNAAINITMRGEEGWVVSHATERNTELAA